MFITLAIIAVMFLCLRISTYAYHRQGRWTAVLLGVSIADVWIGRQIPIWGEWFIQTETANAVLVSKTVLFAGRYVFAAFSYWFINELIGSQPRRRVVLQMTMLLACAASGQIWFKPLIAEFIGSAVHLTFSLYICWQAGRHGGVFSHSNQSSGVGFVVPSAVLYYLLYEKAPFLLSTEQWYWALHVPLIYCCLYWLLFPCYGRRRRPAGRLVEPVHGVAVLLHAVKNEAVKMSLVYDRLMVEPNFREKRTSENLHILQNSSEHLLDMAERMRAGSQQPMHLVEQPCRLSDLLEDALRQCRPMWDESRTITVERSYALDPVIKADRVHLKEVLMNLMCNAADAIDKDGSIQLSIEPASKGGIVVAVRDNGQGIPKRLHRYVFSPYFSTKGGQSRSYGLGLWYSNQIIRRSGAVMSFESEEGQGCSFEITFPRKKVLHGVEESRERTK
ncbi:sensor histidine kinase [Paenibacillus kobensis]|uniref:sensor histidine kinase n=1 Tax=Paenibacillus kobensis TaxID=59841 RepID=UPI0013E3B5E6|nr:HAMP domain-containing sensor histidine kinase [Paenibacillus kobensis]